jgi:hypothetical protein
MSVNILDVEDCAKAALETGMDGIYLANLDELFEFAVLLERRWKRQYEAENITGQKVTS